MNKTLVGVLAAALLLVGNPVPGRGEVPIARRVGLDLGARLDVARALTAESPRALPAEAPTAKDWWGVHFNLAGSGWSSALEVVSLNLGVWSISHYVLRDPWSYINEETIRQNLRTGLAWDHDGLLMNTLCHPAHGSMYYNMARASGLSFWESAPFALLGSGMWEAIMEVEAPSPNDLFFTTCGGIYLGELSYRLSSRILDGRARGLERVGRELLSFFLNPARGVHRLVRGDMFRYQPAGTEAARPSETWFVIGLTGEGGDPFVNLTFRSGNPFDGAADLGAFDYFVHRSRVRFRNGFCFTQSGYGYLGGTRLGRTDAPNHVLGFFLNYDLRNAEGVRLAATSLTGGWVAKCQLGTVGRLETTLQFGATLMGGFDNPYYRKGVITPRDYNFGSGAIAKAEAALDMGKWGALRANFAEHYLVVLDGTPGTDRASFLEASYEIPVYKAWTIGVEVVDVQRDSNYRNIPDITASYCNYRLIAGLRF